MGRLRASTNALERRTHCGENALAIPGDLADQQCALGSGDAKVRQFPCMSVLRDVIPRLFQSEKGGQLVRDQIEDETQIVADLFVLFGHPCRYSANQTRSLHAVAPLKIGLVEEPLAQVLPRSHVAPD